MRGTGTQADPYVVETIEEFCSKISEAGAYVELANDLDCTNWRPPNVQYFMSCNQIDGKEFAIKNINLSKKDYSIGILFRLSPSNQDGVMKNLHWKNIYLNGVVLLISNNQRYGNKWKIQDCTFSCDLFGGRFLQTDYVMPSFTRCSIYLHCIGSSVDAFTPDASVEPPIWDTCNIEINGTIASYMFEGRLVNSQLTGNVEILNPNTSGGSYSPIWISNAGNESYANSLINMTVKCDTTWDIYNASSANGLLVNTTRLQNYQFTGVTQIFIACNDSQMVDISWLRAQGFDVGEASAGFVWHDFLMNGSYERIYTLECGGGSPTFPFTIDSTSNTFSSTVTLTPEKYYCYTVPYNSWQSNLYTISIESCHKYKIRLTGTYDTDLTPYAMWFRNGDVWWGSMGVNEMIVTAPDSSSMASFGIGAINYTGNSVTGNFTITNFEVLKFSYWNVVNGKLVNSSLPTLKRIGAFYKTSLASVSIPTTVKKIGNYSFAETNLTSVNLAPDCTYYDTTFPSGCVINKTGTGTFNFIGNGQNLQTWSITGAVGGVGNPSVNIYPPYDYNSLAWNLWSRDSTDYNGQPVYYANHGWSGLCNEVYLNTGTYTFSVYVKSDTVDTRMLIAVNEWSGAPHEYAAATISGASLRLKYLTTDFMRYELTFEVTATGWVAPRIDKDENSSAYIYVTSPQLEASAAATDFQEYGKYYIPVVVTQTGSGTQTRTTYIPLTNPLGEGETITRTTSNINIPTYSGQCSLTVASNVSPSSITIVPPAL